MPRKKCVRNHLKKLILYKYIEKKMFGTVYYILGLETGKMYFGSTTGSLQTRMSTHMSKANKIISREITHNEMCEIFPADEGYFESIAELRKLEANYILKHDCINKNIPGRTIKEWYQDNKKDVRSKQKQYYKSTKKQLINYYKNKLKKNALK